MSKTVFFKGDVATHVVTNGGIKIPVDRSKRDIFDYGVLQFGWGNTGAGAAQLSASILLEIVPYLDVIRMYQRYKLDVICKLPYDQNFKLAVKDVRKWARACTERDNKGNEDPYGGGSGSNFGGFYV